jgi:glycosyltransferase involved in cell wall biosynthesis
MDIILPVFNGLSDLKKCTESLLKATNKLDWQLHIINDASTDKGVALFLKSFESEPRISIYHNKENLGFVKTVNRGFELTDCL